MLRAFGRIVFIFIFVMLWVVAAGYGVRNIGLSDKYAPLIHSAYALPFWFIATPEPSFENFKKINSLNTRAILGATVRQTADADLILTNQTLVGRISNLSNAYKLKDFLKDFPTQFIYLDTRHITPFEFSTLLAILKQEVGDRILLNTQNRQNKLLAKEARPMWLFEATASELAAFKFMYSIFLEPAASQDADFYILDSFDQRLAEEVHRRGRRYLLKIDTPTQDSNLELIDGIITAQPDKWVDAVESLKKNQ